MMAMGSSTVDGCTCEELAGALTPDVTARSGEFNGVRYWDGDGWNVEERGGVVHLDSSAHDCRIRLTAPILAAIRAAGAPTSDVSDDGCPVGCTAVRRKVAAEQRAARHAEDADEWETEARQLRRQRAAADDGTTELAGAERRVRDEAETDDDEWRDCGVPWRLLRDLRVLLAEYDRRGAAEATWEDRTHEAAGNLIDARRELARVTAERDTARAELQFVLDDNERMLQRHTEDVAELERLRAQRAAALALHHPDPDAGWAEPTKICNECRVQWPCPTAESLGAEP